MNAVTFLLGYAMALSWLAPVLFTGPISARIHPRLSVAGWLVVVATASFAWVAALVILIAGAAHSLIVRSAPAFCVETLGIASAVTLPPTVATVLVVALLAATAAVATNTTRRVIVALCRTRRANRRTQRRYGSSAGPPVTTASSPSRLNNRPPTACPAAAQRHCRHDGCSGAVEATRARRGSGPRAGAPAGPPPSRHRHAQHPRRGTAGITPDAGGGAVGTGVAGDVRRRRGHTQARS